MKRMAAWLAGLAISAATAGAGVGINWVTLYGVYDSSATDLTGNDHALLANYGVTWQLVYAGPNGVIDPPDPANGANGWVGGDDVVWATRVIPQGGGLASDGTSWDVWMRDTTVDPDPPPFSSPGAPPYEDLNWNQAGSAYQRIYQGTPSNSSWYYDSGLLAFDGNYAGAPAFPSNFYLDAFDQGVQPNQQMAGSLPWDNGYQDLGGGWRRLGWFGDYAVMALEGWIWHNKHGFFYVADTSTPGDVWLYADDMGWLYTGNGLYPFLYRASDGAWIWYNGSTNPRWFMNFTSGQWESRP